MIFQGFPGIFKLVKQPSRRALFGVRSGAWRGAPRAGLAALLLALAPGCKEARTPLGPPPLGPDTQGPVLLILPSHDTLVDSTGVLTIQVLAFDRSNIKSIDLFLVGGSFGFQQLTPPPDTTFAALFPIVLANFKHSQFGYYAKGVDILDHATVSDTVTVTVR